MAEKNFDYDFSGWATRNNLTCSDGRTIERDAFKENHGQIVPLVWQHNHNEVYNVIGHALLENRREGVYAYCSFNDSDMAEHARSCVKHHDIQALSIFAKVLKEVNKHVMHGSIKELSLVLSPANPGAVIDNVVMHSDESAQYVEYYFTPEDDEEESWDDEPGTVSINALSHSDTEGDDDDDEPEQDDDDDETLAHAEDDDDETVEDVLNSLTPKQTKIVEFVIRESIKAALDAQESQAVKHNEEENEMTSIFENNFGAYPAERPMIATEDVKAIMAHACQSNCGSLKLAVEEYLAAVNEVEDTLAHADDNPGGVERADTTGVTYGIAGIDWLFPDAHKLYTTPDFLKRRTEWVGVVMSGVSDVPWARIKSMFTDITADAARAKGYVKGNQKVEEVVSLLRRETGPTTIYKKQKLDRDDVIDITDFDVIQYLKGEMRIMWEEELARAILVGDGRTALDTDKIDETKIRPIWTDDELFTIPVRTTIPYGATEDQKCKLLIRSIVKGFDDYEGAGNTIFFTTQGLLSDMLLMEDGMGRRMYKNVGELATALTVNRIVTVPVLKNLTRTVTEDNESVTYNLAGLVVDLRDYKRGADKGGKAEMFEDFDLDINQLKYLYEGRCSGALATPHSALAIEYKIGPAPEPAETVEQPAG